MSFRSLLAVGAFLVFGVVSASAQQKQQQQTTQPKSQPSGQPKFNPQPTQPKVFQPANPPKIINQPKVVQPTNPVVTQPKVVQPTNPPVGTQPKVVQPTNPPVGTQPKVVQPTNPPVVTQPKVVQPPVLTQPKNDAPKVTNPAKVNPPVIAQPKIDPPKVAPPAKVNPPVIAQPKIDPPKLTPPAKVNPPVIAQPKIDPPKLTPMPPTKVLPPNVGIAKTPPTKVAPKIDPVKNPITKLDPAKVDPSKLAQTQKSLTETRKLAEQNLIAKSKAANLEAEKARELARANLNKNLTPEQQKKTQELVQARLKQEQLLRDKVNATPGQVSKDSSKLLASKPATSTKDSAKLLRLPASDNQKLINAKNSIKDPVAVSAINDVLSGKKASPTEIAHLQSQLNNPNLSTGSKAAIASALQNQADIRRQDGFVNSLNQLNGGGFPGKQPFPPPGGGGGGAFGQAFAGGFLGALVGNLVFPGSGVVVPSGYGPGMILPGQIPFDPSGYVGYIDYGPALYYPPTVGLDNSGSVLVQTLPCSCTSAYLNPYPPVQTSPDGTIAPNPAPTETDPDSAPAVVIDPTSQETKLTTRYLRLINSSKEKVTVSIVLRTPSGDEGEFVWLPDEPGKGDGAFTVELLPGEEKDVFSGETPLHGSRARIWATAESGRTWRQFENTDFWLVPETEEDGTHAYAAPGVETAVYNLQ